MYEPNTLDNLVGSPVTIWPLGVEVSITGTLSGVMRDKNDSPVAVSLIGKLQVSGTSGVLVEHANPHGAVIPWHTISMIAGAAGKKP